MRKWRIPILLFVIILISSFYFIARKENKLPTKVTHTSTNLPKEALVQLTKDGFSPSEVKIKQGTAVRWKNISGTKQTVNSDDYPNNQLHRELNFGIFVNKSSVVYTFTKPGTYGYHNQFHPEQKGVIYVEQ